MKDRFKALEGDLNVLTNGSAGERWNKVVRIGQNIRNVQKLMECLTYEPEGKFDGGATKSKVCISNFVTV